MNNRIILLFSFIILSSTNLLGQKQIWDIYTFDDQPYFRVVLDTLNNDTIYVNSTGNTYKISIKSIRILRRERKSKAGIGVLAGMSIGALLMNLYGKKTTDSQNKFPIDLSDLSVGISTGIGIIGGGIIGYWVGAGLGTDEYYNFSKLSYEKKKKILNHILEKNQ